MKVIAKQHKSMYSLKVVGKGVTKDHIQQCSCTCRTSGMWFSPGLKAWCIHTSHTGADTIMVKTVFALSAIGFVVDMQECPGLQGLIEAIKTVADSSNM